MTVFISHSFDDQAEFGNVTDWLENAGVPYWKPAFIYVGANSPEYKREAAERGAQGSTNIANELVDMVSQALRSNS